MGNNTLDLNSASARPYGQLNKIKRVKFYFHPDLSILSILMDIIN